MSSSLSRDLSLAMLLGDLSMLRHLNNPVKMVSVRAEILANRHEDPLPLRVWVTGRRSLRMLLEEFIGFMAVR